jgi:hypothetical protein
MWMRIPGLILIMIACECECACVGISIRHFFVLFDGRSTWYTAWEPYLSGVIPSISHHILVIIRRRNNQYTIRRKHSSAMSDAKYFQRGKFNIYIMNYIEY